MSRVPQLPPDTPKVRSPWRRAVGTAALWLAGWRVEGNLPNLRKFVLVVAPHTSNWDFVVGFLVYLALQIETLWFAKHTALRGPLGPLGRHFGAVAIDRSRAGHVVQAYIEEFNKRESMILTLAPEGTRSRVADWKHGFHHVARGAGVPMVPVALDFSRKRIVFGPPQMPTDDYVADMALFKPFFRAEMAKRPENYDEALPTAVGAQLAGSSRNESRSST
ncbi:MAG: glycerol acyltransferase [Gammaproteobacteria bacterium]|nr:glycerol acyltransferase [Gammaproteobacteria bacterium]